MRSMSCNLQKLYLNKNEERRLLAGHLWIYNNEIDTRRSPLKSFRAGELVQIYNSRDKALGVGYINPHTLLCARLLTRDADEALDKEFFARRLRRALAWRERYFATPYYRLIFGESDGLPGLVVDRFADIFVLQLNTAGMDGLRAVIQEALVEVLQPRGILWRNDSSMRALEGLERYVIAYGAVPQQVELLEHGAKFAAPLWEGQKTGWFFDQSYNRERLRSYMQRRSGSSLRVLDVCSYVGAWGVQAALGLSGAAEVVCVDSSRFALEAVRHNAALNGVADKIAVLEGDMFAVLSQLLEERRPFDAIVLDPPAFIKKRKDIPAGLKAYLTLHELALQLLAPQGILFTTSCSMHMERDMLLDVLRAAALNTRRTLRVVEQLHQAQDHPLHPAIPETNYLKGFVAVAE
jgi:23S rRNA (cytosine1962-C5)-methyltransferase